MPKPEKICVVVKGMIWNAPQPGCACTSNRHSHMTRAKVDAMVAAGTMEYVPGEDARGAKVWIPLARFTAPKRWKKKMSVGMGSPPVATMQLVAG